MFGALLASACACVLNFKSVNLNVIKLFKCHRDNCLMLTIYFNNTLKNILKRDNTFYCLAEQTKQNNFITVNTNNCFCPVARKM